MFSVTKLAHDILNDKCFTLWDFVKYYVFTLGM